MTDDRKPSLASLLATAATVVAVAAWRQRVDEVRSAEREQDRDVDARGRHADTPGQIPWPGWKEILLRTYQQFNEDRLLAVAAGVVFYGLLALFPALTAFVSIFGLVANPESVMQQIDLLAGFVPDDVVGIIRDQVQRIVGAQTGGLSLAFAVGLLVAIWSANAGTKAIFDALNVIYDEEEKRSFIRLNLVSLAFTLGSLLFLIAAIVTIGVIPWLMDFLGLGELAQTLISVLRWPALALVLILWIGLLYRFGPSRDSARWQWLSVGSVLAAVLWMIASGLFSWYLRSFADYNAVYGSLGAVIGMMMWFWLTAIVILLGAELNAELEHQTARDTTTGQRKPMGQRGATMADTVSGMRAGDPDAPLDEAWLRVVDARKRKSQHVA